MNFRRYISPELKAYLNALLRRNRKTTYAQFGEDAVLFAYFAGKAWQYGARSGKRLSRRGFYVDIGAYSPTECSNTYAFYESGWRGINIDAAPGSMKAFQRVRPRDINLQLAVGTRPGEVRFYVWGRPSVFNTMSEDIARQREAQLGAAPGVVTVRCAPLRRILDEHMPAGVAIDFLSVDVEGKDLEVLESNDWTKYRPELVVVEEYVERLEELERSPIASFLRSQRYRVYAWTPPSVIYRREDS